MLARIDGVISGYLNRAQQYILQTFINTGLEMMTDDSINPIDTALALQAILTRDIPANKIELFKQQDVWEIICQIRQILLHPCPQNRSENYPYFGAPSDPAIIVYKSLDGIAVYEQRGLLSLTARQDETTFPITKSAVVYYIVKLVNQALIEFSEKHDLPHLTLEALLLMQENDIDAFIAANEIPVVVPAASTPTFWRMTENSSRFVSPRMLPCTAPASSRNDTIIFMNNSPARALEWQTHGRFENGYTASAAAFFNSASTVNISIISLPRDVDLISDLRLANSDRIRRETVAALASYGLTNELLETWQPAGRNPRESFNKSQSNFLIYLVTGIYPDDDTMIRQTLQLPIPIPLSLEQQLTPVQAIAAISRLNSYMLGAFQCCYAYGLTRAHLDRWVGGGGGHFDHAHESALIALVRDGHINPEEAVSMLNGATENQAWEIFRQYEPVFTHIRTLSSR